MVTSDDIERLTHLPASPSSADSAKRELGSGEGKFFDRELVDQLDVSCMGAIAALFHDLPLTTTSVLNNETYVNRLASKNVASGIGLGLGLSVDTGSSTEDDTGSSVTSCLILCEFLILLGTNAVEVELGERSWGSC